MPRTEMVPTRTSSAETMKPFSSFFRAVNRFMRVLQDVVEIAEKVS
jgi:hypothetical protein